MADLPEQFPTDFPIYPAANVIVGSQQGTNISAIFSTPDPASDVLEFYRQALNESPWSVASVTESETGAFVSFSQPDNLSLSGTISIRALEIDGQATQIVVFLPTAGTADEGEGQSP